MISSAYQYLLSEYGRMETSRYDTHKKSELKQSYNKLLSTNKNSPLLRFNLSDETTNVLIDLKENSRILHNRLYEIFGSSDSAGDLQRKSPYTSRPDVLDVDYIGSADADTDTAYLIKVKQLAGPQINTGDFVPSAGLGLSEGDYSFDLNVGDNAYEFQFKVNKDTTNIVLQEKLARLINRSHIGLEADVVTDGNGSSAIEITSVATGSRNGEHLFYFSDDNSSETQQSGSVKFLGLNNIRSFSHNAVIEVDGTELTSANNSFVIDQSFQLDVKQVTPEGEYAEIGFQRLPETISDELQLFANTYNSLYKISEQDSTSTLINQKLGKELSYISNRYNGVLETIGLSKDADGYMTVNEELMLQSAKDGTLDSNFPDLISLQHQLLNKTSQIATNPFEYLKKTVISYPNPKSPAYTPYHTADYTGLLFDGTL